MLSNIEAVIFAGGFGTRLRSVLADRPKPLALVAGRPFLAWILDWLAKHGVRNATLCTGYLAEMVESELGEQHGPLALRYLRETTPRGTGGALLDALRQTTSPTVLAMNGDSICLADLTRFAEAHQAHSPTATLLLAYVENSARYGRVRWDGQNRIHGFVEKDNVSTPDWINAGVYLIDRNALPATLAEAGPISLELDIFPRLLAAGKLRGHGAPDAPFIDIGIPSDLAAAEPFLVASGLAAKPQAGYTSVADGQQAAVFLDRDGTLIAERHYLSRPEQVELLPGAADGVRWMNQVGLKVLLVTNQSGVGRGYFNTDQLQQVHDRLEQLLEAEGAWLDGIYVCPHHPDEGCTCRKPDTGMIEAAARDHGILPQRSYMIGDKPCDIELGQRVGAATILVRTGYGVQYECDPACRPDMVCDHLPAATEFIARSLTLDVHHA